MKACVLQSASASKICDVPIPEISEEEVLIRVALCGVCMSELHDWESGIHAGKQIFGHEPVGFIEAVGARVIGFQPGDRVTGLIGRAFAEYTKANYRRIIKVPDHLENMEALGEPLSCLMSAAKRTPVQLGDNVAIVGLGFMGLGFLQLMRSKGAGTIIAVDPRLESLELAMRFGADVTTTPGEVPEQYIVVERHHHDRGVAVTAEVSGTQAGLKLAAELTAIHGHMSIVGYHQGEAREVDMELWNWKGLSVLNAHERREAVHMQCMQAGLNMIANKRFNMRDLVTHEFSLDEVDQAYAAMKRKPEGFVKAVIRLD